MDVYIFFRVYFTINLVRIYPKMDGVNRLVFIWDLDGTLIDSRHRTMYGKGKTETPEQLQYWFDLSTKEWINQDRLLPLVQVFKHFVKNFGGIHVALTARTLRDADVRYLRKHRLNFNILLDRRDFEGPNDVLKKQRLMELLHDKPQFVPFLAFDDDSNNWPIYKEFGFAIVDPMLINRSL